MMAGQRLRLRTGAELGPDRGRVLANVRHGAKLGCPVAVQDGWSRHRGRAIWRADLYPSQCRMVGERREIVDEAESRVARRESRRRIGVGQGSKTGGDRAIHRRTVGNPGRVAFEARLQRQAWVLQEVRAEGRDFAPKILSC